MHTTDESCDLIVKEFMRWMSSLGSDQRVAALLMVFLAVEPHDADLFLAVQPRDRFSLSAKAMDQMAYQSIVYLSGLSSAIASGGDTLKAFEDMVQELMS